MPSTLIPAPELALDAVAHLMARARRGPDEPAGGPVTLPTPLTTMHMTGEPQIRTPMAPSGEWRPWNRAVVDVPEGERWSLYGLADLRPTNVLAGLRITTWRPASGDVRREEFDLNVLHVPQVPATPQEYRTPRLGYLVPPIWIDGGRCLVLEFLASSPMVAGLGAITFLGYRGPMP